MGPMHSLLYKIWSLRWNWGHTPAN